MKARVRQVVPGLWAASRGPHTAYGTDPSAAFAALRSAETLALVDEIEQVADAACQEPAE